MPHYVGGRRARLIKDNVYNFVKNGLTELDWFDTPSEHLPLVMHPKISPWDVEVTPNTITVSTENAIDTEAEMGSSFAEHRWQYFVDIFAEDDSVGLHLATDVKDMLIGHMTVISEYGPDIAVYDLSISSATPVELFTVEVENISMDKGRFYESAAKKFWWQIAFDIVDAYGTENY